jgi:glycosyltransferase involved in cell wall biosynthesis
MPKVSIIVPIYNVEQYLAKCLNSILAQTHTDWECLLIDDCSPDNSALICKKFCDKDKRFKYIKKPQNEGLGFARNTGLDNATGDYISFIDSDDYIQPNFYSTLIPYAQQYGVVRCAMNIVNAAGKITSV